MAGNRPIETIRVARYVDIEGEQVKGLQDFTNKTGRAIQRAGATYSVGSMALTEVPGSAIRKSINRLSNADKKRVNIKELAADIDERLKKERPRHVNIEVQGIGLYGEALRKGLGNKAKLGFTLVRDPLIADDIEVVQIVMSDNNIPEVRIPIDNKPHVAFGEVYLNKLLKGEGENPHLLVPKRAMIPDYLGFIGIAAEPLIPEQA
jgi:hypothetical protein